MIGYDPFIPYTDWSALDFAVAPWRMLERFGNLILRRRRTEDIPKVLELMRRVYQPPHGPEAIWRQEAMAEHERRFREGQLMMLNPSGCVVADSTAVILPRELALRPHTWKEATDRGTLGTHDPDGDVFYGVDIAVDPDYQGQGLARRLYEARMAVARRMGCRWFAAGARIPGYHLLQDLLSPSAYVAEVVKGTLFDPTLTKQLRMGFTVLFMLPNYLKDVECCDHAVLIAKPVL
jgi:GNAT superfamily N-acetyltransferase